MSLGYHVEETPEGFVVERNLAHARYWGLLHKAGVRTLTGHEVRPFWSLHQEVTKGRIAAVGTTVSWGMREDGTLGTVEDYSLDTDAGRATIRSALAELGWCERMPLDQRIGLWVAVVTAVLTVLFFATWGAVALLA